MHGQLTPFDSERARIANLKSQEVRRKNKADRLFREARERKEQEDAATVTLPADAYIVQRIARVRTALDRYEGLLMLEVDAQKASWLATVIAKLSDLERVLSGRPAPGNYRPTAPRRKSPDLIPITPE